jgi:hypothetical protein
MQAESLHGTRSREWVAPNLFRRKKDGTVVFDVIFRDADDRQRQRRLDAKTERAARREARAILAARDGGERIVAADLTLDQVAERDYFPLLDGLVAAGRRAERGRDRYVYDYRRYVSPTLGSLRLGEIEPRHLADLIRFMRVEGFSEASIYNALRAARPSTGSTRPSFPARTRAAPAACSMRSSSPRSSATPRTATGPS